jgi:hypothetical protein
MLFIDYYIDKVGKNILFDPELKANSLEIDDGDMFQAHVSKDGRISLIKVKKSQDHTNE